MADKELWQVTPEATDVKNDDGVIIGGQTAGTRYAPLTLIANFVHNLWASFINALTAKTSFANGDKIPVVNGSMTTAMEASKLLELTAKNALTAQGSTAEEQLGEFFLNKLGIFDENGVAHNLDLFNLCTPIPEDEKNWFNPNLGKIISAYITGLNIVYDASNKTRTIVFKMPKNKSFILGQGTYTRLDVLVTSSYPVDGTAGDKFNAIKTVDGRNYIEFNTLNGEYVSVFFYNALFDTTATPEDRLSTMSCSSSELGYIGYSAPQKFGLLFGTDYVDVKDITNRINSASDMASDALYAVYDFETGSSLVPIEQHSGQAVGTDGVLFNSSEYTAEKFKARPFMFISGRSTDMADKCLAVILDYRDSVIGVVEESTGKNYDDFLVHLPANAAYVMVNSYLAYSGAKAAVYGDVKFAEKSYVDEEIAPIDDAVFDYVLTDAISASQVQDGKVLLSDGGIGTNASAQVATFSVTGKTKVAVTGRSPGNSAFCLACAYASDDSLLQVYEIGSTGKYYSKFIIDLPQGATYINVNSDHNASYVPAAYDVEKTQTFYTKDEVDERLAGIGNYWKGKTLWWCGTSIPAGGSTKYPNICGSLLGATTINKAVGGSMCRANVRTGDYVGANFYNITSALTMTKAEIEAFITNYATIQPTLTGGAPATLSDSDLTRLRAASFEDRLLPYLDGTYDMPDLFVIDHGHNDFKYTMPDDSSDISLEPTIANISGGVLAEDTYMTSNNCEKLELYVGSLANVDPTKKAAFVASLNRNCYKGAINFLITTILHHNPFARIVFISNYEYEHGEYPSYAPLIVAQEDNAASWAFPLCEVYKMLGFSNHIIPGTKNLYDGISSTYDRDVFKVYNPDGVHPHSQPNGVTNEIYAGVISEFLKTCR